MSGFLPNMSSKLLHYKKPLFISLPLTTWSIRALFTLYDPFELHPAKRTKPLYRKYLISAVHTATPMCTRHEYCFPFPI